MSEASKSGVRRFFAYFRTMAAHPKAVGGMAILSFVEALFLPGPPPDVMLAPMTLARPGHWARLAALCTLASVAGGLCGWALGFWGSEYAERLMVWLGLMEQFARFKEWFNIWGLWVVVAAGFSPLPYKVFTIGAGLLALSLPAFILGSLLGRGMRFFLVAAAMRFVGASTMPLIKRFLLVKQDSYSN